MEERVSGGGEHRDTGELTLLAARVREQVAAERAALRPQLPLRLLDQRAHFTTPASDRERARKAVERGFEPFLRLLERHRIPRDELATTLDVSREDVDAVMDGPRRAPLVLVDAEDAQAAREDVAAQGRDNAVHVLREADWGPALRFYRPGGFDVPWGVDDLVQVLLRAGEGRRPEQYPVDGIIWPKVESGSELQRVCRLLELVEQRLGLEPCRIRMQFLVESGSAVSLLPRIVDALRTEHPGRLCGIVYGISDHAADLRLPAYRNDHPVADHARLAIVNAAAAAGVPAIDAMTLNYPVSDPAVDEVHNRRRILERIRECFDDTLHGARLGMSGKWVGHPAQLFACLLAWRTLLPRPRIEQEVQRLERYAQAVSEGRGATMIGGVMTDRANDRHTRTVLRRAAAMGLLEPRRARALGVLDDREIEELERFRRT